MPAMTHTLPPGLQREAGTDTAISTGRFFELSLDLLCIASTSGFLKKVNPAFRRLLGWSEAQLLAHSFFEFIHPEDVEATRVEVERLHSGVPVLSFEHRLVTRDGRCRVILWTAYPDAEAGLFYAVGRDISRRKQLERELRQRSEALLAANARLEHLATTDELTGLANRRALHDRFAHDLACARRDGRPLSLLLIDVDHFKRYNDRYGHAAGDDALRRTGAILRQTTRRIDCPSRFGGEEFAVLLPGAGMNRARTTGERLLRAFRSADWPRAPITVSIGVATLDCAAEDIEAAWQQLTEQADEALYRAKGAGRDRLR